MSASAGANEQIMPSPFIGAAPTTTDEPCERDSSSYLRAEAADRGLMRGLAFHLHVPPLRSF